MGLGLLSGYQWVDGRFIYGLELGLDKQFARGAYRGNLGRTDSDAGFMGSLRGRLGYNIGDFLLYAAGGGALLSTKWTDQSSTGSESYTRALPGWTLGAGVEWGYLTHWTARLEYRYSKFAAAVLDSQVAFPTSNATHSVSEQSVRAGLVYRFTAY